MSPVHLFISSVLVVVPAGGFGGNCRDAYSGGCGNDASLLFQATQMTRSSMSSKPARAALKPARAAMQGESQANMLEWLTSTDEEDADNDKEDTEQKATVKPNQLEKQQDKTRTNHHTNDGPLIGSEVGTTTDASIHVDTEDDDGTLLGTDGVVDNDAFDDTRVGGNDGATMLGYALGTDDGAIDGTHASASDGTHLDTEDGTVEDGSVLVIDDVDGTRRWVSIDDVVEGTHVDANDGAQFGTEDGTVDGTLLGSARGTEGGAVDGAHIDTDDVTRVSIDDGTFGGTDDGAVDGTRVSIDDGTQLGTDNSWASTAMFPGQNDVSKEDVDSSLTLKAPAAESRPAQDESRLPEIMEQRTAEGVEDQKAAEAALRFFVGQDVECKDGIRAWEPGIVTSLAPLKVKKHNQAQAFTWDEVRLPPQATGALSATSSSGMSPAPRFFRADGDGLFTTMTALPSPASPVRVFEKGARGVPCYRIPAIVRTATGALLAFAEARYSEDCSDKETREIAVRRSTDDGRTWSDIAFAAGSSANHVGNPYPIATRAGDVVLVYVKHPSLCKSSDCGDDANGNGVVMSHDDGLTWSDENDVSRQFGDAAGSMPGPGAGVELADSGRLVVPLHQGAYNRVHLAHSDDAGETWAALPTTFPDMDEGTIADLGEGNVLLNMRHRQENIFGRAVARSVDGGLTWSKVAYDQSLIGPVSEASLAAIGGSVFFANPANSQTRTHLTVKRSDDGGQTWSAYAGLEVQSALSSGYSSIVHGNVGDSTHSGLLYESSDQSILFATFPLDLKTHSARSGVIHSIESHLR